MRGKRQHGAVCHLIITSKQGGKAHTTSEQLLNAVQPRRLMKRACDNKILVKSDASFGKGALITDQSLMAVRMVRMTSDMGDTCVTQSDQVASNPISTLQIINSNATVFQTCNTTRRNHSWHLIGNHS